MLNTFLESLRFGCWIPQRMVYVTQITICGCDLESGYIISIFCNIQLVPLPLLTIEQLKGIKVLFDLITTIMLPYMITGCVLWLVCTHTALCWMRVEGLNGIPCFSMFKDRELIDYMHSLIPFHHSCCDIYSVCTKKKSFYKEFTKCTFMHGVPCSQCGSPMREGSISTARHNKSLQIYELITTTWLLFFFLSLWSVLQRLVKWY